MSNVPQTRLRRSSLVWSWAPGKTSWISSRHCPRGWALHISLLPGVTASGNILGCMIPPKQVQKSFLFPPQKQRRTSCRRTCAPKFTTSSPPSFWSMSSAIAWITSPSGTLLCGVSHVMSYHARGDARHRRQHGPQHGYKQLRRNHQANEVYRVKNTQRQGPAHGTAKTPGGEGGGLRNHLLYAGVCATRRPLAAETHVNRVNRQLPVESSHVHQTVLPHERKV